MRFFEHKGTKETKSFWEGMFRLFRLGDRWTLPTISLLGSLMFKNP